MVKLSEDAYIVAGDLNRCRAIESLLRDIVSQNNDNIADDEYAVVARIVHKWVNRGFESIDVGA